MGQKGRFDDKNEEPEESGKDNEPERVAGVSYPYKR